MNYKPKPIKPFKTLDEEAAFWDTHDVSALFKNPKTPLSALPLLESEKNEVITLRIQKSVKERIAQLARSQGINLTTLARMWLIEHLREVEKSI